MDVGRFGYKRLTSRLFSIDTHSYTPPARTLTNICVTISIHLYYKADLNHVIKILRQFPSFTKCNSHHQFKPLRICEITADPDWCTLSEFLAPEDVHSQRTHSTRQALLPTNSYPSASCSCSVAGRSRQPMQNVRPHSEKGCGKGAR